MWKRAAFVNRRERSCLLCGEGKTDWTEGKNTKMIEFVFEAGRSWVYINHMGSRDAPEWADNNEKRGIEHAYYERHPVYWRQRPQGRSV